MPACHAGGRGFESLPDRHLVDMIIEIALQTVLAMVIGGVWLSILVVTPAARNSLDKQSLGYFLKSFFFRLNLFLILMILSYLGITYFFQLEQYELIWSSTRNLIFLILLGANLLNLFIGLFLDHEKNKEAGPTFKIFHSFSILILAATSFVALYYLVEKFLEL